MIVLLHLLSSCLKSLDTSDRILAKDTSMSKSVFVQTIVEIERESENWIKWVVNVTNYLLPLTSIYSFSHGSVISNTLIMVQYRPFSIIMYYHLNLSLKPTLPHLPDDASVLMADDRYEQSD